MGCTTEQTLDLTCKQQISRYKKTLEFKIRGFFYYFKKECAVVS